MNERRRRKYHDERDGTFSTTPATISRAAVSMVCELLIEAAKSCIRWRSPVFMSPCSILSHVCIRRRILQNASGHARATKRPRETHE